MSTQIYDRIHWPTAKANPLVAMLQRGDEWFSNKEIVAALGSSGDRPKALISQWPTLIEQIGEENTAIISRGLLTPTSERGERGGGQERCYSRKALVIIAMRAQTPNAAAFRDWVAEKTVRGSTRPE